MDFILARASFSVGVSRSRPFKMMRSAAVTYFTSEGAGSKVWESMPAGIRPCRSMNESADVLDDVGQGRPRGQHIRPAILSHAYRHGADRDQAKGPGGRAPCRRRYRCEYSRPYRSSFDPWEPYRSLTVSPSLRCSCRGGVSRGHQRSRSTRPWRRTPPAGVR